MMLATPLATVAATPSGLDFNFGVEPEQRAMPSIRFGVVLGNCRVLLPAGIAAEFLTDPPIYAVPRAPRGLVGLVQLRGGPVAVFSVDAVSANRNRREADSDLSHGEHLANDLSTARSSRRSGVLVLGTAGQYGGIVVSQAPQAVTLSDAAVEGQQDGGLTQDVASCVRYAITSSAVDSFGLVWSQLDVHRLMSALADPRLFELN